MWPAGRPPVGQQKATDIVGQQPETWVMCTVCKSCLVCLIQIITSPHSYSMGGIRRLDMKMNVSEHLQACLFFLHGGSTGVLLS